MKAFIIAVVIGGLQVSFCEAKTKASEVTATSLKDCRSATEFKKAFDFLKEETDLGFSEAQRADQALKISSGCDGAARRFKTVYLLLKKSGVNLHSSFELGHFYAQKEDESVKVFTETFKKIYLENYLDMDFKTSLTYAQKLSENFRENPKRLTEDFINIVKFCTDEKEMALQKQICAEMALQLTEFSPIYKRGLYRPFIRLYSFLRTHPKLGLSQVDTLRIMPKVLSKGQLAEENFRKTIEMSLQQQFPLQSPQQVLHFALKIASQSQKVEAP